MNYTGLTLGSFPALGTDHFDELQSHDLGPLKEHKVAAERKRHVLRVGHGLCQACSVVHSWGNGRAAFHDEGGSGEQDSDRAVA